MNWSKFFQVLLGVEENVLPIFIHNPNSQKIIGAIIVTESIFNQALGFNLTPPTTSNH